MLFISYPHLVVVTGYVRVSACVSGTYAIIPCFFVVLFVGARTTLDQQIAVFAYGMACTMCAPCQQLYDADDDSHRRVVSMF